MKESENKPGVFGLETALRMLDWFEGKGFAAASFLRKKLLVLSEFPSDHPMLKVVIKLEKAATFVERGKPAESELVALLDFVDEAIAEKKTRRKDIADFILKTWRKESMSGRPYGKRTTDIMFPMLLEEAEKKPPENEE